MYYPNGTVDENLVSVLSRPYAQAVAGSIIYNHWDPNVRASWSLKHISQYTLSYAMRSLSALYLL